jgi:Tfp pilus assembly protein PilF
MWCHIAKQHLSKGNFTGAQDLYEKCIAYDPCDGRAWLGLSKIYWKRQKYVESEQFLKDGLYYSPKNPFLLQGLFLLF